MVSVYDAEVNSGNIIERMGKTTAFYDYPHISQLLKDMPAAQNDAERAAGKDFREMLQNGTAGIDSNIAKPLDEALDPHRDDKLGAEAAAKQTATAKKLHDEVIQLWNEHPEALHSAIAKIKVNPGKADVVVEDAYNAVYNPDAASTQLADTKIDKKPVVASAAPASKTTAATQPVSTAASKTDPKPVDPAAPVIPPATAPTAPDDNIDFGAALQKVTSFFSMIGPLLPQLGNALIAAFKGDFSGITSLIDSVGKVFSASDAASTTKQQPADGAQAKVNPAAVKGDGQDSNVTSNPAADASPAVPTVANKSNIAALKQPLPGWGNPASSQPQFVTTPMPPAQATAAQPVTPAPAAQVAQTVAPQKKPAFATP